MRKPEKMVIYNVFPLLAGSFTQWGPHLQRAADMGFNWIFVNPIQYPGYSGSLYSISDYFKLNPLMIDAESKLTPEEQVKAMVKTADQLGLRIMIDLVINHCAFDSKLVDEHPEWFQWENGHVAHPSCDEDGHTVVWGDLGKFDHNHSRDREGLYQFFFKVVKYLLDLGFKGFRCDAAYQVPRDIWERLIRDTKAIDPDVFFFAETLGCTADQTRRTAEAGFDYIFNSSKWWDFNGPWLMQQYNLTRETAYSVSFPESHDTTRLFQELNGNLNGMKQRYLFSSIFSAGSMVLMGYEFGFRGKPHVVETRPHHWEQTDVNLMDYIKKINDIKEKYLVFQEDAPTEVLHTDNPNVLLIWKGALKSNNEALVILNKDIWNRQYFQVDNLQKYVHSRAPLTDVSPEYPVDYIAQPFVYELNPGQGLIMVTQRD